MLRKAFSLIELLVVIAIIGVLAAIAVPAYKSYQVQGQIASVLPLMNQSIQYLQVTYAATGSFPTKPSFAGASFPTSAVTGGFGNGWNTNVSYPNVGGMYYFYSSDGLGAGVGINFLSLSTPGFIYGAPGDTAGSLYMGTRNINGTFTTVCGGNNNGGDIPVAYRPSACNCTNVGIDATTGFVPTGTGC